MAKAKSKASILKKPVLNTGEILEFAEAGNKKPASKKGADSRVFFAPEGYKRLTVNIREDLHKKLKLAAIEQGTTVGDMLSKLAEQHLSRS